MNLKKMLARAAVTEATNKILPMEEPKKIVTKGKVAAVGGVIAAGAVAASAFGVKVPDVVLSILGALTSG
jgi:hypothetical protein